MLVKDFDVNVLKNNSIYYVLQFMQDDCSDISIKLKTYNGLIDYEKCSIYKLNNGYYLVELFGKRTDLALNNLIASDGTNEEIINLQLFERIKHYIDKPLDSSDGGFLFHDSIAVWDEWRCHYDKYGPETFVKNDGEVTPLVDNLEDLYVYEPILSINSTAHIIYIHANVDENFYVNEDPFPRTARTLQENLKQIVEWSDSTEEPWNNTETIALRANNFIDKMNFTQDFKQHIRETQADMQLANYLKGDPNARSRPSSINVMTGDIYNEIQKRVGHLCVSNLARLFPGAFPNEELIADIDQLKLQRAQDKFITMCSLEIDYFNNLNKDTIKDSIKQKDGIIYPWVSIDVDILANYREILDSIIV
jgi:hypothetical protein